VTSVRLIGPGRAGGALALALRRAGWPVDGPLGRDDDVRGAAQGVDLVVIATPDAAVAEVAAAVEPEAATVVAHVAGSLGLDVLGAHPRKAALHPLVSLPNAEVGADRLRGAWFAVAGDPLVDDVVAALDGRSFPVADADRALYHAGAVIASNHLVALLAQAERVAARTGVPFEGYLDLAHRTLDNVAGLGAVAALTGPAARGDVGTVARHLEALGTDETDLYGCLSAECTRLAKGAGP
jgi:predicted short-subunit dehydrogenase-like oxidoreductase (DUF2520 family)